MIELVCINCLFVFCCSCKLPRQLHIEPNLGYILQSQYLKRLWVWQLNLKKYRIALGTQVYTTREGGFLFLCVCLCACFFFCFFVLCFSLWLFFLFCFCFVLFFSERERMGENYYNLGFSPENWICGIMCTALKTPLQTLLRDCSLSTREGGPGEM